LRALTGDGRSCVYDHYAAAGDELGISRLPDAELLALPSALVEQGNRDAAH